MVSPRFDVLEPGAPTYHERLASLEKIAAASLRLIVRIQPYVREVKSDLLKYFQQYRNAGVYGVTIEGIKYFHKVRGMVKAGGDYVYPCSGLKEDFCQLRDEAHKNNLKFFCAENRPSPPNSRGKAAAVCFRRSPDLCLERRPVCLLGILQ